MLDRDRCLSDGELRSLVDGELPEATANGSSTHLLSCPDCRDRFDRIQTDALAASALLARTLPDSASPPEVGRAYAAFRQVRYQQSTSESVLKGASLMARMSAMQRGAIAGVALVAMMVVAIALAPVSTLADNLLNRFRVQQFAAITIPMDAVNGFGAQLESLDDETKMALAAQLMGLGELSTTLDADSVSEATSVAEANAHLNGNLKEPGDLPGEFSGVQPKIFLGEAVTAEYTLNVERARQLLTAFGLDASALPDPAQTPQATFRLDVPASAAFVYEANDKHLIAGQMASPTLEIPDSVDPEALRETLLMVPGLPADVAAQLRNVKDWESTLIIPVPEDAKTSTETVNGQPALAIEHEMGVAVLWQDGGTLFGVAGQVSLDDALDVANSMD